MSMLRTKLVRILDPMYCSNMMYEVYKVTGMIKHQFEKLKRSGSEKCRNL